ncbi:hypothetical protein PIIN_08440 [Serendipita indica DSM 11827]|uniref:Uncharacterized protein n=1 Tax=Serendipita indica (strain DSM 11827) TaxID=1109443 RepID=G4TT41_SERID|nr:hypothetical protein PIIN_08440 [Serendipita indica DSM 11827]
MGSTYTTSQDYQLQSSYPTNTNKFYMDRPRPVDKFTRRDDVSGLTSRSHNAQSSSLRGHKSRTYEPMSAQEHLGRRNRRAQSPLGSHITQAKGLQVVQDHNPITQEESEKDNEKIAIKIEEDEDYAQHKTLFQTSPRHGSQVQQRIDYAVLLHTMHPALSRDRLERRARSPIEDRMVSSYQGCWC